MSSIGVALISEIYKQKSTTLTDSISCLKARIPDFVGRKHLLEILHKDLSDIRFRKHFQQNVKVRVLWGKGGFGKSELAIEFANRHINDFSLCWTFLCDTQEHIDQGYSQLAEKLGLLTPAKESSEKVREKVHFYLENHRFKNPWLLIFDNVEKELMDYPQRGGMILVTSQKKILNPEFLLEIPPFTNEESVELIEKITRETRGEKMELLADELERIPLLINYAAHYIKATPGCDAKEYHELFSSHLVEKDGPLWKDMNVNCRYLKSLAASWEFPLRSLEKENPLAVEWLFICSYLYPEHIPESWVDGWLERRSIRSDIVRKELLKSLQNYGIIRYEEATKTFSLHRFFQYMLRESRKNYLKEDLGEAVSLLAGYGMGVEFQESSSWRDREWWYLNAREIDSVIENHPIEFTELKLGIQLATLYQGMAEWTVFSDRFSMKNLQEALKAAQKALQLKCTVLPPDSAEILSTYECLAWVFYCLSRYHEALDCCSKAEAIVLNNLDVNLSVKALVLATKGNVLVQTGRLKEALHCFQDEYAIRLNIQGEPGRVGRCFYSQGKCLAKLNLFEDALAKYDKALEVFKITCGEKHPWFFSALKGKALALAEVGRHKDAIKLLKQLIPDLLKSQGEKHGSLSSYWWALGQCYLSLGKIKLAKESFEKTLNNGIANQNLYNICWSYWGLGMSYLKTKDVKKGLEYLILHLKTSAQIYKNTPILETIFDDFARTIHQLEPNCETRQLVEEALLQRANISLE